MSTDQLIARRPSSRTKLAAWYGKLFRAQEAESLSGADLAKLLNVTPANLYYWRRRLRELGSGKKGADRSKRATGLVRVDVRPHSSESTTGNGRAPLEIRLSNSRSIVVPPGYDPVELSQLVTTLETC